jgi:hypothetical protein
MKNLLSRVKRALSCGLSSRGSDSCSSHNGSQGSPWSSFYMPSPHETMGSSRYLAHDDAPDAMDGDDISICTTKEMEKYESVHHREFSHTRFYDVNLRGLVWRKSFPSSSRTLVGENSTMSLIYLRVS